MLEGFVVGLLRARCGICGTGNWVRGMNVIVVIIVIALHMYACVY